MRNTEDELRELICEIGRNVWNRGYVAANDGNITARIGEDLVLCTPTGVSKGRMDPDMLAVVDLDGHVVKPCREGYRPTSEVLMHLAQYRANPKIGGAVHAHPMYATVMAIRGRALTEQLMPESSIAMPEVPLASYATPSTPGVGQATAKYARTHTACLMEHHGAFTWGPDVWSAYLAMERLEYTAQITYLLERCDGLRELPPEEVAVLESMRAKYGL
ncbi:class II aldolase/adducin family protein [Cutibacterium avidum]|uniref:class II aldolase/adducin family protein n=1 Tax=Cutibacterium avidum TaxID=33010 RepID=UPI001C84D6E7|nr:class II aldolase/adducin family protein [Cutibacterium avidum]